MKAHVTISTCINVGVLVALAQMLGCQRTEKKPEPFQPAPLKSAPTAAPALTTATVAATATAAPAAKPSVDPHKNHPHPDGGAK